MTDKTKSILWWVFSIIFTLSIAYYQRTTGPTYPVRGKIEINNQVYKYKLLTSNDSDKPAEIYVKGSIEGVTGYITYRKYKSEEKSIKEMKGCLWQERSEYYDCIHVKELYECPDDYVVLRNKCGDINILSWILRNQGRSRYSFSGIFEENSTLNITRQGWKTTHECIWNDYSDTLFLFDDQDKLVLRYHY